MTLPAADPGVNPFLAPGKRRPLVVGHRGVPLVHQENSLAGFRRAVELGVPAVELDVRLTADRRAVCVHDEDLLRLTGHRRNVGDLTWDQLSRLRLRREILMGHGEDGAVVVRYQREEPIPLLAEVLAEIAGRVVVNIELKLDAARWWPVEVGEVVAAEIARAGVDHRVIVTSFDPRKLRAAARARPGLAIGFCFDDTMLPFKGGLVDGRRLLSRALDYHLIGRLLGSRVIGAEHTLIGEGTVRALHAQGVAVGTHTLFPLGSTTGKRLAAAASSQAEVERLVALGVDWIEADDPERLLALVE